MQFDVSTLRLYEDASLLAVNKPSGLLTIQDGYNPDLPHIYGMLQSVYGRLWVIHRLDRAASGVLLLARTPDAHRTLSLQFEHRLVDKLYHAIVEGKPDWKQKRIDLPLLVNGDRRHRTLIDNQRGKMAVTDCEALEILTAYTLVAACPKTGYLHQIRAHLAAVGHPILADPLYNKKYPRNKRTPLSITDPEAPPNRASRLALHALRIDFSHPESSQRMLIKALYPEDFTVMVQAVSVLNQIND